MTTSEVQREPSTRSEVSRSGSPARPTREAPARPAIDGRGGAPVIVKRPPPWSVRASQLLWVMALIAGAAGIVYLFVIRTQQLPDIVDRIRGVDASRVDATYDTAADILFWTVFAAFVVVVLSQIILLVSFVNRRPRVRWFQFGTIVLLAVAYFVSRELVAFGDRSIPLHRIQMLQFALALLALLVSTLPVALRWSRRRHDVRHGPDPGDAGEL